MQTWKKNQTPQQKKYRSTHIDLKLSQKKKNQKFKQKLNQTQKIIYSLFNKLIIKVAIDNKNQNGNIPFSTTEKTKEKSS